eukprot:6820390-Prymnesium_polylepis.1
MLHAHKSPRVCTTVPSRVLPCTSGCPPRTGFPDGGYGTVNKRGCHAWPLGSPTRIVRPLGRLNSCSVHASVSRLRFMALPAAA